MIITDVEMRDKPQTGLQLGLEIPYAPLNIILDRITRKHVFDMIEEIANGVKVLDFSCTIHFAQHFI